MGFDPAEFFRFSQQIMSTDNPTETVFRTAMGRAYYSAFLSARAKVPANMLTMLNRAGDIHWVVRVAMEKRGYPKIADKLKTLSTERGYCDYDMSVSITKARAEDALKLADNTLQLIAGIP
jgi:uncharacterized protein (UPF0332 family)